MNGEGARTGFRAMLASCARAQATARTKQGQGLENIGLSRAIGPRQRHEPRGRGKIEARIGAKIRKAQPADERARHAAGYLGAKSGRAHTRMGIST